MVDLMYDYLKDFDTFYKYYISLHNYALGDGNEGSADVGNIRDTHRVASSTFCKILEHYKGEVNYVSLMFDDKSFFDGLIVGLGRHFDTGVKLEFIISSFNILIAAFSHMTSGSAMPYEEKIRMLMNLRKISGAYTVVAVSVWSEKNSKRNSLVLNEEKDLLAYERERFTNYLNSRRSLVVFIDMSGHITRINRAAVKHFGIDFERGDYNIMDILDYHFISFDTFLKTYNSGELKPVRLMSGQRFDISVEPLLERDGVPVEYCVTLKNLRRKTTGVMEDNSAEYLLSSSKFKLTHTESKICDMIEKGLSSKEIAENINISVDTVKTHRKNIRKKLELNKSGANMYIYLKNKKIFKR